MAEQPDSTISRQTSKRLDFGSGVLKTGLGIGVIIGGTYLLSQLPKIGPIMPAFVGVCGTAYTGYKAYNEFADGHYLRGASSLAQSLLFAGVIGVTVAGLSVPVLAGVSLTALATGTALALMGSEIIYDNGETLLGMFGIDKSFQNPDLKKIVSQLPKSINDPNFAHMVDPDGNFQRLVELCSKDQFIDNEVAAAIGKLSKTQLAFFNSPENRQKLNQFAEQTIKLAGENLNSPSFTEALTSLFSKDPDAPNFKRLETLFKSDQTKRQEVLNNLSFDELIKLRTLMNAVVPNAASPTPTSPKLDLPEKRTDNTSSGNVVVAQRPEATPTDLKIIYGTSPAKKVAQPAMVQPINDGKSNANMDMHL